MEEEKSQPPDHHLEAAEEVEAIVTPGAAAAAAAAADPDAPVYDDYMDDEEDYLEEDRQAIYMEMSAREEADRQNRAAAIAADEEMAHRMYMEELMGMEEWEMRDMNRPSLRAALELPLSDFPSSSSSSSRAGVGFNTTAPGKFWAGTPPCAPKDPVVEPYVPPQARARGTSESVEDSGTPRNARIPGPFETLADKRIQEILATAPSASNGGPGSSSTIPEAETDAVFLPRSVTMAANRGAGTNTTSRLMRPGPRDFAGSPDFATTPARKTQQVSKDAAGSSSTQQVSGDGEASTVAIETPVPANVVPSAGCGAMAPRARHAVPANDGPVSTKRRALLANADSAIIFGGMEEGHNNIFYESMVVPDEDEKPEQVEVQSLNESLQLCLPRSEPCNPGATVTEGHEFSLQDFCQRWGVAESDMHPDEPGPSTRAPKVPPLGDHEVPTFDCGICFDTLPVIDLFHGLPCSHKFCASCMSTYVEGRIRSTELPIPCPDTSCGRGGGGRGVLHPEKCKKAIDYGAFVDWGSRLAENALRPDRRAYCPNRRCGVPLETSGEVEPAKAACPACGEALCATCGMQWSSDGTSIGGHDCAKGPDAALLWKLAQERRWKQCPSCKTFVERTYGCNRMTCRCRFVFCYQCGKPAYGGQVGGAGLEPCRCNNVGLALAMGHHHQAHPNIVDQMMQLPPVEIDLNLPQPPVEIDLNLPQPPVEVALDQPVWDIYPEEDGAWFD